MRRVDLRNHACTLECSTMLDKSQRKKNEVNRSLVAMYVLATLPKEDSLLSSHVEPRSWPHACYIVYTRTVLIMRGRHQKEDSAGCRGICCAYSLMRLIYRVWGEDRKERGGRGDSERERERESSGERAKCMRRFRSKRQSAPLHLFTLMLLGSSLRA